MQMKPIGWTKRRVQLEVEWLPYISALESGVPMRCRECGAQGVPRRKTVTPVAVEGAPART